MLMVALFRHTCGSIAKYYPTMKALVYRGPEKIGLEDVPMPKIIEPDDAIVKVTTSTI